MKTAVEVIKGQIKSVLAHKNEFWPFCLCSFILFAGFIMFWILDSTTFRSILAGFLYFGFLYVEKKNYERLMMMMTL